MPARRTTKQVTKFVRFTAEETALLEEVSRREHLSEGTLMRKLVLDGLARVRLDQAMNDCESGDVSLSDAVRQAGVSLHRLMAELDRRGVELVDEEHLASSVETLADLFGGSAALSEAIAQLRSNI